MDFAATKAKLLSRAQLVTTGRDAERLRRAVAQKTLRRVHAGWYVLAEHWDAAYPEEQQLMRVIAAADRLFFRGSALVLGSAAVMHGLPMWNVDLAKVHIAGSHTDGSSATPGNVARHRVDIPADDLTTIHGIPCTTLDRTVYDLVRTQPLEAAVTVADAALRSIAWSDDTHTYDEDAAARWKARMMARFAQARGARGVRQGEWVIAFADGRADRPGESVSRLQLRRLGFRPPELQVRVPGPNGRDYVVDFFIVDADAWGEMDGKTKYHQLLLTRGATPREIFDAEKAREDWIRGTTQKKMARWGMAHISTPEKLGARLKRFGILPGDA